MFSRPGSPAHGVRRRLAASHEETESELEDTDAAPSFQPRCIPPPLALKSYQVDGLAFLAREGPAILADEMGLGKTVQSIALFAHLLDQGMRGPHIVVAPKSTLPNWTSEAERWCPSLRTFTLIGSKDERALLIDEVIKPRKFDLILTSFEGAIIEKSALRPVRWHCLVVDEAHRLKNEESKLSTVLRAYSAEKRVLLTGTPLQNNLHELWSLLNFLRPDVFTPETDFVSLFAGAEDTRTAVSHLHTVLEPFMLRREKRDVEDLPPKKELLVLCPLSKVQRFVYAAILRRDAKLIANAAQAVSSEPPGASDALPTAPSASGRSSRRSGVRGELARLQPQAVPIARTSLQNVLMQLRKAANHPYLFDGVEPGPPFEEGEHLVRSSGKLRVIDALLPRLKAQGSRVLLFSQMTRVLDILEDYCRLRGYKTCRIDGSTDHVDRGRLIHAFNKPNSDRFIFLLSTRAGGLGLNLATADSVILYDTDWNPSVDAQAMDRAHRIGQTRPVNVYRLITEDTVEERILERARYKMRLDAAIIKEGRHNKATSGTSASELLAIIHHGADRYLDPSDPAATATELTHARTLVDEDAGAILTEAELDRLLARGADTVESMDSRVAERLGISAGGDGDEAGLDSLRLDGSGLRHDYYSFEGQDFSSAASAFAVAVAQEQGQGATRERSARKERAEAEAGHAAARAARQRRHARRLDFQFYPTRLYALQNKEDRLLALRSKALQTASTKAGKTVAEFDDATELKYALSPKEAAELLALHNAPPDEKNPQWFPHITRRDYSLFVRAVEELGWEDTTEHATALLSHMCEGEDVSSSNLSVADVAAYGRVFMARYRSVLLDSDRVKSRFEKGEARRARVAEATAALKNKLVAEGPRMNFSYAPVHLSRGWTVDLDRQLVISAARHGTQATDRILQDVRVSPLLAFDWFSKSRTENDIKRRLEQLVRLVQRDEPPASIRAGTKRSASPASPSRPAKRGPMDGFIAKAKPAEQ
jgi:SWI/SNF-related matrix-associated actin-dependent regulator of chromatin subfamily A member 5